ncbi:MAG TPA: DUF6438 domain-containing protein [Anaerolineales bacterium]|nr:DUF6438 domain-containing protein [Anaerolineales bacterium]
MSVYSRTSTYVVAATAVVLSACSLLPGTPIPGPMPADFEISVERGPCFGTCPVYTMTVRADGTADYEGIRFVAAEGTRSATLDQAQVERVYDAVVLTDFFALQDRYEAQATDLPSMSITVNMNGQTKTIYHYGLACNTEFDPAPSALCDLETALDEIPLEQGWVSGP